MKDVKYTKVQTFPVGALATNCYFLIDNAAGKCIVVDPGAEGEKLLRKLTERELTVSAIFLTHAHFDHIMALPVLRAATGAPVYVHEADEELLCDNEKNQMMRFGSETAQNRPADLHYRDGDVIPFGDGELRILHTPGHTKGSVSILGDGFLLSGDTLFRGGTGRFDMYGGSYAQLKASLHRLSLLPGDCRVYPGHGASTRLSAEKAEILL